MVSPSRCEPKRSSQETNCIGMARSTNMPDIAFHDCNNVDSMLLSVTPKVLDSIVPQFTYSFTAFSV